MNFWNDFRYAMKHMRKKIRYFLIAAIVMIVGMFMVTQGLGIYYDKFEDMIKIESMLGDNSENYHILKVAFPVFDTMFMENYKVFLMDIEDIVPVNYLKSNSVCIDFQKSKYQDIVNLDAELSKTYNIKNEDGEFIELRDTDDYKEVAVGCNFKNKYKIGDIIYDEQEDMNLKVVDYIAEGSVIPALDMFESELIELDNIFIGNRWPTDEDEYELSIYTTGAYIICDKDKYEGYRKKIFELAEKNNVYITLKSYDEYKEEYMEDNKVMFGSVYMICTISVFVMFTLILIISMVVWLSDAHDIGILRANGFSNKNVRRIILTENIVRYLLPGFLSYEYMKLLVRSEYITGSYVLYRMYFIIFVAFLLETIVVSLVCHRILANKSAIELISAPDSL